MFPVVFDAMAQVGGLQYNLRFPPTSIDLLLSRYNQPSAYKMDIDEPSNHNQETLAGMAPDGSSG
jgi:hypothetical protein